MVIRKAGGERCNLSEFQISRRLLRHDRNTNGRPLVVNWDERDFFTTHVLYCLYQVEIAWFGCLAEEDTSQRRTSRQGEAVSLLTIQPTLTIQSTTDSGSVGATPCRVTLPLGTRQNFEDKRAV